MNRRFLTSIYLALALSALAGGCGSPPAGFVRYTTYAANKTEDLKGLTAAQWKEIDEVLVALFGTPDEARLPELPLKKGDDEEAAEPLDWLGVASLPHLQMAAGPVGSDEFGRPRGLYREHCAHCHGVTGDGNGPTAIFLNPYPRDYRPGIFKFKSTPVGHKPTHADLKKILVDGITGTAMPSFKLLPENEVEALADYVRYLAIRGEAERALIRKVVEDEHLYDIGKKDELKDKLDEVKAAVVSVALKWKRQIPNGIAPRPEMTKEEVAKSRAHGRELFYGKGECIKCHGTTALGDGTTNDYDNWVKEFFDPNKQPELVSAYVSRGMLPPRNIRPRNLRLGVYRGGLRPVDIYWRIVNGIEGTPMPAAPLREVVIDVTGRGLTNEPKDAIPTVTATSVLTFVGTQASGQTYVALQAGNQIYTVNNLSNRTVSVAVPGEDAIDVSAGAKVFVKVDNGKVAENPFPAEPNPKTLTREDVWDLVNYVQSLPYEPLSSPHDNNPTLAREVN